MIKVTRSRVVYTAVFGRYDHVLAVNPEWDCDFVCFTDNLEIVSQGWQAVLVQLDGEPPAQANRRYKMLPHKYLSKYMLSLYVDGNIRIVADPSPLFEKYLAGNIIAIPKHQDRVCTYEEASLCIAGKLVDKEIAEQQMKRYARDGFPLKFGLTSNGIILRKHFDANVIALMTAWWEEYSIGAKRDQLSLQYLIWKHNIHIATMEESAHKNTKYFRISVHPSQSRLSVAGRIVDYIGCNRHRNFFYGIVYRIIHKMGEIQVLRNMAS